MPHMDWCGKPCGECDDPCSLDESLPCSPRCENLRLNGECNNGECVMAGCDAIITKYRVDLTKLGIPGMVYDEKETAGYIMVGGERLMVFVNDIGTLDVAIDELGDTLQFDSNLEWVSANAESTPITDETYSIARKEAARMMRESLLRQAQSKQGD